MAAPASVCEKPTQYTSGAVDSAITMMTIVSKPAAIAELRRNLLREKAAQRVFETASVQEREVEESQVADRG